MSLHTVHVDGRTHRLLPDDIIGQGGEAIVYHYGKDGALKVYMEPDNPAYNGKLREQDGARHRLEECQHKLRAFPANLPSHVVTPTSLAHERAGGKIVGYVMPFLNGLNVLIEYADRQFREQGGIDANMAVGVFRSLHELVTGLHALQVVIGDFNDLNVLVSTSGEAYLIDADSMQFGTYLCRTFTSRFVDPLNTTLVVDPQKREPNKLVLSKTHSPSTDWYAFSTMLFQSLLFLSPYGGVHLPKQGKRLTETARIANRVTVLSKDVTYPKAAVPLTALPDELLKYFTELYEQDKRGVFPVSLLENLRWTTCSSCGIMHARPTCPACAAPGAVKQAVTIRGTVKATRLFRTHGRILFAVSQGGETRYVYQESGTYKREGDVRVCDGQLDSGLRVRIRGEETILAKGSTLVVLAPDGTQTRHDTQSIGRLPIFDANHHHVYWLDGDRLVHDDPLGQTTIGTILPNRTLVWVGNRFGFGFFRAGAITRGLVFDVIRPGINDTVPLPPMTGNLIDATCTFSDKTVWFMVTIQEGADVKNHCYVVSNTAQLLAHAEAIQADGTWLGEGIRGHMAQGQHLYAATDAGIVRVGIDGNRLPVEREYPDTEPFVNADSQLLPSREGIVVVSTKEITLLQIR